MKIKRKHIVIGGLMVLAISLMSFAGAKKAQASQVFEKIVFKIVGIRNVDLNWSRLKFHFDLMLMNPTANDFSLSSAGAIRGKAYRVYRGNQLLVSGTLNNIGNVNLPAGGSQVFKDILVEIPIATVGQELLNMVGGFQGLTNLDNIKNINYMQFFQSLRYEVDIEGFGSIFTFKDNVKV